MKRILEVAFLTAVLVALCGAMSSIVQAEEYFVPDTYDDTERNCVMLALEVIVKNNMNATVTNIVRAPFGLVQMDVIDISGNTITVYCGSDKSTGTSYIDTSIIDVMKHFGINNPI